MQTEFFSLWSESALTSVSFFWKALWAFMLGYVISSMIQVFVTRERMRRHMGEADARSVGLATFFGFLSSSCSFAALASAKSLFKKGAGFIPAMAFLLASTNLVVELGFVIAVFLSWQFVVGEYLGGLLLIVFMWGLVSLITPEKLIEDARKRVESEGIDNADGEVPDPLELAASIKGWKQVAKTYFMEWQMVWKDVTIGFTVAGVIAAFVPASFFQALFSTGPNGTTFLDTVQNALIGPVAAFFTFIGSMGNIPLAAVLYASGVSFAGVMAFIFSDLVVFPIIRIHARYYGWRMSLFIAFIFLASLVLAALALHWGFAALGLLPPPGDQVIREMANFPMNYGVVLNLIFLLVSLVFAWLAFFKTTPSHAGHQGHEHDEHEGHDHSGHDHSGHDHGGGRSDAMETALTVGAVLAGLWLVGGLAAAIVT